MQVSGIHNPKRGIMNAKTIEPGIVQLGPGTYRVEVRVRVKSRIVERHETVGGTREKARERRYQLKRELRERKPAGSLKFPFTTFSDVLRIYREKRGPFSIYYERSVKAIENDFGLVLLEDFADRFEEYVRLLKVTPSRLGTPRSPAAINRPISIVRAAFSICYALGLIKTNPVTKVRFPEMEEIPRDITISEEDRGKLIEAALKDPRTAHLADAINYAMQVPIRKSELVNMKIEDIDLFGVHPSVRVRNGTTKNDSGSWKPIPPDMLDFFVRRKSEAKSKDEPVFGRFVNGTTKDRSGDNARFKGLGDFKNAWDTVRREAGLPRIHFHDTRHVSATNLIDNGTPEQVVMTIAGWKTNMLRIYYHRDPKKALGLVCFARRCEDDVKTSELKTG
jgi:integrase